MIGRLWQFPLGEHRKVLRKGGEISRAGRGASQVAGLSLDNDTNDRYATRIEAVGAPIAVIAIPTDKERLIGLRTLRLLPPRRTGLRWKP